LTSLRECLHDPKFWLQLGTFIFTVVVFVIVTYPYYQATLTKSANIVLDVIPSLGRIDNDIYFTETRPVNVDIIVDFYVIVWNNGNGPAENISITLREDPSSSSWFDFHWSIVYINNFSYRPASSEALIRVLLPGQQAQVQYHITFAPSGYDELILDGKETKIVIEMNSASTPSQRMEYKVQLP
jgi:hypothetical protein